QHQMAKRSEPFCIAIPQHYCQGNKRQIEAYRIDKPGTNDKSYATENNKTQSAVLRYNTPGYLTDRRPRIQCVEFHVQPPVECHRCTPCKDHTGDYKGEPYNQRSRTNRQYFRHRLPLEMP